MISWKFRVVYNISLCSKLKVKLVVILLVLVVVFIGIVVVGSMFLVMVVNNENG